MKISTLAAIFAIAASVSCWENVVPKIPTNRRSQFYLRHDDGAYKYGFDSGDGIAANQVASGDNQVEGFYSFPGEDGQLVKVKYTSGVQGFVPEINGVSQAKVKAQKQLNVWSSQSQQSQIPAIIPLPPKASAQRLLLNQDENNNSDASYQISFNTGEHAREEKSDSAGNVEGQYSYVDEAGAHDLSYIAGPEIGFKVVGGSLATANGLAGKSINTNANQNSWAQSSSRKAETARQSWQSSSVQAAQPSVDGSYSFSFNTGDHSRTESSDNSGNVMGRYAYTDEAGSHDLSYNAGAETGFVVTGGSLAQPNSFTGKALQSEVQPTSWSQPPIQVNAATRQGSSGRSYAAQTVSQPAADGSYSFSFNTGDHSRTESSDNSGNVMGRYAYTDEAGSHDLSYNAGAETGFVVTGGSLAQPNGFTGKALQSEVQPTSWSQPPIQVNAATRQGSSGRSYAAQTVSQPAADGSYSFSFNTGDHSRTESSDNSGNVMGRYAYTDEAGSHDLSYNAGAETGFVVTGGSLAQPNSFTGKALQSEVQPTSWSQPPIQVNAATRQGSSGRSYAAQTVSQPAADGSYSFSFNTGDHSRTESSDNSGNVMGRYAYTDEAGSHDLSYNAGAETGFVVTGGSLAQPNGFTGKALQSEVQPTSWSQPPIQVNAATRQGSSGRSYAAQTVSQPAADGSYSFSFNTGDHSRTESSDNSGNVMGRYAYTDEAGSHDLSYNAGAETGFVVTGGSLAQPNSFTGKALQSEVQPTSWSQPPIQVNAATRQGSSGRGYAAQTINQPASDGSYSFSVNTGDHIKTESSDSAGRVKGSYAVKTNGGHQQLSFDTGGSSAPISEFKQIEETQQFSSNQNQGSFQSTWKDFGGPVRAYSNDASVHPTFTVITPSANQRSLEHGPKNAIILGYLPPKHAPKHGYIYDTPN